MTLDKKMRLGAGLAALLWLAGLAIAFTGLVFLERMERAGRAVLDAQLAEQRLVRVLNEALLSGGSSTSRKHAQDLMPQLDAMLERLAANTDVPELKDSIESRALPLWNQIKPLAESLLARRTLSAEEAEDQIALGKIIATSDRLSAELASAASRTDGHLSAQRFRVNATVTVVGALAALFAVLLVIYVYRAVQSSLGGAPESMAQVAAAFARGDLVAAVPVKKGDISSAMAELEQMRLALAETVRTIRASASAVGTATQEIALGHSDLSTRTEEQASSLEETAASMEQMTATVSQNADNARKASQLAVGASEVATRGGQAVGTVVRTMAGISDSSKKIADIVGVIDSIAFQTNILALNAAVEAARAGEQGRGFAVVAAEVRNLAQRSSGAAKEIRQLISDSVGRVEAGSRQVTAAGETMGKIVASVKQVTDLIADISAASQEQSQNLSQVNDTVMQLEQVTQQNAAMVEEAAAASGSLEEQAAALIRAVAAFKLEDSAPRGTRVEREIHADRPAPAVAPPALPRVHRSAPPARRLGIPS